jgi:mono/diheme cytochrome c family protein
MRVGTARVALIAVVATLAALALGGLLFIYSGVYNVAATAPHTGIESWILEATQERSIAARAGDVAEPPPADSAAVLHGFEHFRSMCVVCHGAPGVDRGEIGRGITPQPPELSHEAEEYSDRELFWITKHGIKMAGMPAFGPTHSDEEIWGIVAFMNRLPEMTPEEYAQWESRVASAGSSSSGDAAGHSHEAGAPAHEH